MEREQAIKYMRDLLTLMIEKKGSDSEGSPQN